MNTLRKHTASAFEQTASDAAPFNEATISPDARTYDDDVTPEGIAAVKARIAALMPKGKWKVIDGYAGDRASVVG